MANIRSEIQLSDDEIERFVEQSKTAIVGTINHDGFPHMMPMWYSVIDGLIQMHTYKTSQKVKNIVPVICGPSRVNVVGWMKSSASRIAKKLTGMSATPKSA